MRRLLANSALLMRRPAAEWIAAARCFSGRGTVAPASQRAAAACERSGGAAPYAKPSASPGLACVSVTAARRPCSSSAVSSAVAEEVMVGRMAKLADALAAATAEGCEDDDAAVTAVLEADPEAADALAKFVPSALAADQSAAGAQQGRLSEAAAHLPILYQSAAAELDRVGDAETAASMIAMRNSSRPATLLASFKTHGDRGTTATIFCPARRGLIAHFWLEDLSADVAPAGVDGTDDSGDGLPPRSDSWSIMSGLTSATEATAGHTPQFAVIDCSPGGTKHTVAALDTFVTVLRAAGIVVAGATLPRLVGDLVGATSAAVNAAAADGAVSLLHPSLSAGTGDAVPTMADASSSALESAWHQLEVAVANRSALPALTRRRSRAQQIADVVLPPFPVYVISFSSGSGRTSSLSLMELSGSQRRYDVRGSTEDMLKQLMQLTSHGPIACLVEPGTHMKGLMTQIGSVLLRQNRVMIATFMPEVLPDVCVPWHAVRALDPKQFTFKVLGAVSEATKRNYSAGDLERDVRASIGRQLLGFSRTAAAEQASDATFDYKQHREDLEDSNEGTAADPPGTNTSEAETREGDEIAAAAADAPAPDGSTTLAPAVEKWLDVVYRNPARVEAEDRALEDLQRFVVIAYTRTSTTAYERASNPTHPGNCVTALCLRDYTGAVVKPLTANTKRDAVCGTRLPSLAGYDVMVVHNAKDFLLLMTGDPEITAFLKRGGRVWCTAVAQFQVTAFRGNGAETSLLTLAAEYGASDVPGAFDGVVQPVSYSASSKDRDVVSAVASMRHGAYLPFAFREGIAATAAALALIFQGQRARARRQHQLIAVKERLESILAFVEIERNGIFVDRDIAKRLSVARRDTLRGIDAVLATHVPKQVPLDMVRTWSWTSHTNLDTYFFGGRVRMSGPRDHALHHFVPSDETAKEGSKTPAVEAKKDGVASFLPLKQAKLIVELVNHAGLIAQIAHDPALETFAIAGGADLQGVSQVHLAGLVGRWLRGRAERSLPPLELGRGGKSKAGGSKKQANKAPPATTKAKPDTDTVVKSFLASPVAAVPSFRVVVFDLETTGLDPFTDCIIELCFFDVVSQRKFSTLVKPPRDIPAASSDVHHITDDMVADKPSFEEVLPQLLEFLGQGGDTQQQQDPNESVLLVAHAAALLDAPILTRQMRECGFNILEDEHSTLVYCDTMPMLRYEQRRAAKGKGATNAKRAAPNTAAVAEDGEVAATTGSGLRGGGRRRTDRVATSLRLSDLKRKYGITTQSADEDGGALHRAVEDTLVTWEVLAHALGVAEHSSERRAEAFIRAVGRNIATLGSVKSCIGCHLTLRESMTTVKARTPHVPGAALELYPDPLEREAIAASVRRRRWDQTALDDLATSGSAVAKLLSQKSLLERASMSFLSLDAKTGQHLFIHPDDCIRQEVKLTTASTGRTSSAFPNCQNIPKNDKSDVRKMFCSRFGKTHGLCVEVDYKQLEVNVQALLCQDRQMMQDLRDGIDFHIKRCVLVAGEPYEQLLAKYKAGDAAVVKQRQTAKIMSFQRMYGAGKSLIQRTSGARPEVIDQMIKQEELQYPGIARFNRLIRMICFRDGNPGLPTHYIAEMPNGCRVAFRPTDAVNNLPPLKNYPIQAYGAELVQAALGRLYRRILAKDFYGGRAHLVNFVHDSVWFDTHIDVAEELVADAQETLSAVSDIMEASYPGIPSGVHFGTTVDAGRDMFAMEKPNAAFFARIKAEAAAAPVVADKEEKQA